MCVLPYQTEFADVFRWIRMQEMSKRTILLLTFCESSTDHASILKRTTTLICISNAFFFELKNKILTSSQFACHAPESGLVNEGATMPT